LTQILVQSTALICPRPRNTGSGTKLVNETRPRVSTIVRCG
jgi:hypothetical protein